jgi:hypothetical protein
MDLQILATDPNRDRTHGFAGEVPVTNQSDLSAKAERCRRLAAGISDPQAADVLSRMAKSYQEAADQAEPRG